MRKTILAVSAVFALAATAMGQAGQMQNIRGKNFFNYAFPSAWNPKGVPADEITQLITITWDDNQYSGMDGSGYEPSKDKTKFADWGFVGGKNPDPGTPDWTPPAKPNPLNITETGPNTYGLSWAHEKLDIPMTFNMITGLFVNVYTDNTEDTWDQNVAGYQGWQNGESALGWTSGEDAGQPLGSGKVDSNGGSNNDGYRRIPIAWGREYRSAVRGGPGPDYCAQLNTIGSAMKKIIASGKHEIGNHTIDHMETNSVLPGGSHKDASKGFGSWGGEGFDADVLDEAPWGITYNEAEEYGTSGAALTSGWKVNIGRYMTKDTWKAYIMLSEKWLTDGGNTNDANSKTGGLGYPQNKIWGFRTPRLEVNSNLYYGLKELGYVYDCGLEEGYEKHVNGTNFLWPYTMDNGIRNSWTKTNIGERVFVDSTPAGFWQMPVNCLIVPGNIRSEVVASWNAINAGLAVPAGTHTPASEWDGKITGFDFNMWILYGMTKANFVATMKYTLDQRLAGNKSPFQYGAHTDYYTPIYDNGTLQNSFNEANYGLSISRGWNTYKDRQTGTEEWVAYAKGKGSQVKFVTAIDLVDSLQKWSKENWDRATSSVNLSASDFQLWIGGDDQNKTLADYADGNTGLTVPAPNDGYYPQATFAYHGDIPNNLTHIELNYRSRTATAVRLVMKNGTVREVILAHRYSPISHYDGRTSNRYEAGLNDLRNTGRIPLTSFDFPADQEGTMNYASIDPANIDYIEIVPLAPDAKYPEHGQVTNTDWWTNGKIRTGNFELKFKIQDIKLHTGTPFSYGGFETEPGTVSIAKVNVNGRALSLAGISNNALKLNIAQTGKYDISVFSANGRLLQSFRAENLAAGINTLKLNNLAKGVYMIKVQGIDTKQQLTKSALVM